MAVTDPPALGRAPCSLALLPLHLCTPHPAHCQAPTCKLPAPTLLTACPPPCSLLPGAALGCPGLGRGTCWGLPGQFPTAPLPVPEPPSIHTGLPQLSLGESPLPVPGLPFSIISKGLLCSPPLSSNSSWAGNGLKSPLGRSQLSPLSSRSPGAILTFCPEDCHCPVRSPPGTLCPWKTGLHPATELRTPGPEGTLAPWLPGPANLLDLRGIGLLRC